MAYSQPRLGESDLLSAGPFLGSFIAILGTNIGSHFLHWGSEHITILALIALADGKNVPL